MTGFSRQTLPKVSSVATTLSTMAAVSPTERDTTCSRPKLGEAACTKASGLHRNEPSLREEDGCLSDSGSDLSSDDEGCSSYGERLPSSMRMNISWDPIDEQRLLAFKKEDKPWSWIFRRFPSRTPAAVRTRWNMLRPRGEYASGNWTVATTSSRGRSIISRSSIRDTH